METSRDQTRALVYAIGVHLFAGLLMFAGLLFNTPSKPVISGGAIEAVLVDMNVGRPLPKPASQAQPNPPAPKPPKPAPEPPKPEEAAKPLPAPPPPPPQAKPDDVTDQRPVLPTVEQEALNLERQREELRVQEEQARRQQELEDQRQRQLEDIRRQRDEAARETQQAEQRLADARDAQRAEQILNQAATPAATPEPEGNPRPGQPGEDSLESQYASLLVETIRQRWRRPAGTPVGIRCVMRVRQIIGGEVIAAEIGSPCNAPDLVRQSIIDAIERASPLPYEGFESVFNRQLELNFEYDGQ